jgi:hypothetical protein
MDALICLDMSHQWRMVEVDTPRTGVFQDTPRRGKLCMVCGSLKIEVVNWRGYIITRSYKPGEVYITNARKLSPVPNERRAVYRRLMMGKPPKNVCRTCWLQHESADCPYDVE